LIEIEYPKNTLYYTFILRNSSEDEKLDGPAVSALRRAIAEIKQCLPVIGLVTKNVLCRAPSCFERHGKLLVPATFAVVNTHQRARVVGYGSVLVMCNP
jgi:hypothetical protein